MPNDLGVCFLMCNALGLQSRLSVSLLLRNESLRGLVKLQSSSEIRDQSPPSNSGPEYNGNWWSFFRSGEKGRGCWRRREGQQCSVLCTWLEFEEDEFSSFSHNITRKGGKTGKTRDSLRSVGHTVQSTLCGAALPTHIGQEFGKVKQSFYLNTCLQHWDWRPPWILSRFQMQPLPSLNHVAARTIPA